MQINELKTAKRKSRKRIGRGGKRGTYSGRGIKGQKSRTGSSVDPLFEGGRSSLIERLKKVKGFKSPLKKKIAINLSVIEKRYSDGETVSLETLIKKDILKKKDFRRKVKLIGNGKLSKKVSVSGEISLSESAQKALGK